MNRRRVVVHRDAEPAYLTTDAFAKHFGISYMTVNRLCHSGAIKWIRVGHAIRIPISEVARYTKAALADAYSEVWGDES